MQWIVDIPNPYDITGAWIEVGSFDTQAEAVEWARNIFGADENGRLDILTAVDATEEV